MSDFFVPWNNDLTLPCGNDEETVFTVDFEDRALPRLAETQFQRTEEDLVFVREREECTFERAAEG